MGHKKSITKRLRFVDMLTVSEVGMFVGRDARIIKRRALPYGSVNAAGWHIYTVSEACQVFEHFHDRLPRASEVATLLIDMGMPEDHPLLRSMILKLWANRVVANKDLYDKDL